MNQYVVPYGNVFISVSTFSCLKISLNLVYTIGILNVFMKNRYNIQFHGEKEQNLAIILVAFLITFVLARLYSLNVEYYVLVQGFHIHHFFFGTIVLALAGVLTVTFQHKKVFRLASALIGVGIGLFADEIGLLLNCTTDNRQCSYLFPDSLDFIGTIAVIIIVLIVLATLSDTYRARRNFLLHRDETKDKV